MRRIKNNCRQTRDGKFHCWFESCQCFAYKQADEMCGGNCEYFLFDDKICRSDEARKEAAETAIRLGQEYLAKIQQRRAKEKRIDNGG